MFALLRAGLWEREPDDLSPFPLNAKQWQKVYELSVQQTTTGIIYKGMSHLPDNLLPQETLLMQWAAKVEAIERRNKKMNAVLQSLLNLMNSNGLHPVLQKGQGVAAFYPEPLLRESGDIDLYFTKNEYDKATALMVQNGATPKKSADGGCVYLWQNVEIEHHTRLVDIHNPFKKKYINSLIERYGFVQVLRHSEPQALRHSEAERSEAEESRCAMRSFPFAYAQGQDDATTNTTQDDDNHRHSEAEPLRHSEAERSEAEESRYAMRSFPFAYAQGQDDATTNTAQDEDNHRHSEPQAKNLFIQGDPSLALRMTNTPAPILNLLMLNAHILKHILGHGVGLRQFCDIAMGYHALRGSYNPQELETICRKTGLYKWTIQLHAFLKEYLGADDKDFPFADAGEKCSDELLEIVLSGGNFGQYGSTRSGSKSRFGRKFKTLLSYREHAGFSRKYGGSEAFWVPVSLIIGNIR